jgi:hypothetical protein
MELGKSFTKEELQEVLGLTRKGFINYQEKALVVLAKQVGKVNMVKWQDKDCEEFMELCMQEATRLMKEDL